MRSRLFTAALVLLGTTRVSAQVGELQPGARVRIYAPGIVAEDYVGTLLQFAGDTLVVAGANLAQVRIPKAQISRIELSRGKSRGDGAIAGMKWGIPIMAGLGLIASNTATDASCVSSPCRDTEIDRFTIVSWLALSGALYGAGIGALIGKEHWEEFDVNVRTSLRVRNGRVGLGFAYAF